MNKHLADELRPLLKKNTAPPIQSRLRAAQISQLANEAQKMDILGRRSLSEHIFLQASYLSRWIWLMQAALLLMLFYYSLQGYQVLVFSGILLLAPCLTLALIYELSKSFSFGMWELEASCRYNLWQLFVMRICFVTGTDVLVLLGSLICFRMVGGSLWQFSMYVLLPFFLTSALCLCLIQRYPHRISQYLLSAAALIICMVLFPFLQRCDSFIQTRFTVSYEKIISAATLCSLFLFVFYAVRLCRRQTQANTVPGLENM